LSVAPVVVKDTQLDPGTGAAQSELPVMSCVAPALTSPSTTELFVVVAAELKSGVTVSALAVISIPLTAKSKASLFIILGFPCTA
jgi:hypothetical protein